ncbi:MAG TPA: FmdB family zinc ribbon protein [Nitrolancea sp.]|jgi:putative FmdB family regulatory protein|nr:FmdB family zinc ribbon protein [Nitrolancea sp.]
MPIYEYACESCGHHFDVKQRFSDDPITICPECGEAVRRVLHPAGIIFKGSGFYINDSKKTESSAVPSAKSESNGSSDSVSESTPAKNSKTNAAKEAVSTASSE